MIEKISINQLHIKPLEQSQIEDVKYHLVEVVKEVWNLPEPSEQLVKKFEDEQKFDLDENNLQASYFDNNGLYLILTNNKKIVGSGAIKRISQDICKLKRFFIQKEFRGQKWGLEMWQKLELFAVQYGYKKIRLGIASPEHQQRALNFYTQCGFYEIPRYDDSKSQLFMEKILVPQETTLKPIS